jgi:hypothetical protein
MSTFSLRAALRLDAVVSGANGAAYLVAAEPIGDLLGLSPSLLRGIGAFFVGFAGAVWLAGSRRTIDALAVTGIAAANVAWALGSVAAAVAGWGTPTTEGTVWIVAQGLVVAGFAELQLLGLRRRTAALAR